MDMHSLIDIEAYAEPVVCLAALAAIISRKQLDRFRFLAAYLAVRAVSDALLLTVLHLNGHQLSSKIAYPIYFWGYWVSHAAEAALSLCIVYQLFRLVLEPLNGLQRLGSVVMRVIGAMAVFAALGLSLGPRMTMMRFMPMAVSHLSEYGSVIAVGLLLLAIFATRPMGLSFRSRAFGVSLGFGVLALTQLTISSLTLGPRNFAFVNMVDGVAILLAVATWILYFAQREPQRRDITLSPGSTLMRWNRNWLAPGGQG